MGCTMTYYEYRTLCGRWCPAKVQTAPPVEGGRIRRKESSPIRVRNVREIPPEHEALSLDELYNQLKRSMRK